MSKIRNEHPRMGVRKVYFLIKPDLDTLNIKIGRDALFDLMAFENMLVTKRRRKYITTNSHHWYKKYPNLIKDVVANGPNQIWVSDITYIRLGEKFMYLFLTTDAYSKKIVGYKLARSLESYHAVNSIQDALNKTCKPISGLIHHSDRGIQYCCKEYVELLKKHNIYISMTENSDPLENPIAERINGILKDEYLYEYKNLTTNQLDISIHKYNEKRPHLSCDMLTPMAAHMSTGKLKRRWKNHYKKEYI